IVAEIEDIKAYMYKVETIKEKMELYIYISSSKLIFSYLEEKIQEEFQRRFPSFQVQIKVFYEVDGNVEEKLKFYEDKIIEVIKSQIQSSNSWIKDLKWELSNDSLIIFPPNNVAFHLMQENGLLEKIKNMILDELGIALK